VLPKDKGQKLLAELVPVGRQEGIAQVWAQLAEKHPQGRTEKRGRDFVARRSGEGMEELLADLAGEAVWEKIAEPVLDLAPEVRQE
jgi:hypothetical protein